MKTVKDTWLHEITDVPKGDGAAWDQLVMGILNSDTIRVKHKDIFDDIRHEGQEMLAEEMEEHFDDELSLAIRMVCGISYHKLGQLRHLIGFQRDEAGKLLRLNIGIKKLLRMPTITHDHEVKKLVKMVVQDHGLKCNFDTKCVILNIKKMIAEKVAALGANHPAVKDGICIQLLGDGYNHFRRLSIVNFCCRIMGADVFSNSPTALQTAAIWEDGKDYDTVKENTKELNEMFTDMHENGLEVEFEGGL